MPIPVFTIVTGVAERAQSVAQYAIEIASQQHQDHDVQWSIGAGKVSILVMRQTCLTCQEECSWQLKDKTRKININADAARRRHYGPRRGDNRG